MKLIYVNVNENGDAYARIAVAYIAAVEVILKRQGSS